MKNFFRLSKRRWIAFLAVSLSSVLLWALLDTYQYLGFLSNFVVEGTAYAFGIVLIILLLCCGFFCIGNVIAAFQLTSPKNRALRRQSLLLCAALAVMLLLRPGLNAAIRKLYPVAWIDKCVVTEVGTREERDTVVLMDSKTGENVKLKFGETQRALAQKGDVYYKLSYVVREKDGVRGFLRTVSVYVE